MGINDLPDTLDGLRFAPGSVENDTVNFQE